MYCFEIIFTVFVITTAVNGFKYTTCASPKGKIDQITFDGCKDKDADTCEIKRGSDIAFELSFTTFSEINGPVMVTMSLVELPHPIPLIKDVCTGFDLTCPLAAGTHEVKRILPPIADDFGHIDPVNVRLEIKDPESNENVLCIDTSVMMSN